MDCANDKYKVKTLKSLNRFNKNGELLVNVAWHPTWEPASAASQMQIRQYHQSKNSKYIIGDRISRTEANNTIHKQLLVKWPNEVTTIQNLIHEYGPAVVEEKMYASLTLLKNKTRKRKRKTTSRYDGGSTTASSHKHWCNMTHLNEIKTTVEHMDSVDIVLDAESGYTSSLYHEQKYARGLLLAVNDNPAILKSMMHTRLDTKSPSTPGSQMFGLGDLHTIIRTSRNVRSMWFDFCSTYNVKNQQCIAASYIHRVWTEVFVCSFTFCLRTGRQHNPVKRHELAGQLIEMASSHGYQLTLKAHKVYGSPPMWFGCFLGQRRY